MHMHDDYRTVILGPYNSGHVTTATPGN